MESKVEKKMTSKLSEWGPEGLGGFIYNKAFCHLVESMYELGCPVIVVG